MDLEARLGAEAVKAMTDEERLKAFLGEEKTESKPVEPAPIKVQLEKKTIPQRNKEARIKQLNIANDKRKRNKELLAAIDKAPALMKELDKRDKDLADRQAYKEQHYAELDEAEKRGEILTQMRCGK